MALHYEIGKQASLQLKSGIIYYYKGLGKFVMANFIREYHNMMKDGS
jgi:hypothetical protein